MNRPTEADYRVAEHYYATLSLSELRRYQSIIQAQIPLAFQQRKEIALTHLQKADQLVTEAIYRKAFGEVVAS